jgi:DNA-binding beta-propeller fold protein YncE
MLSARLSPLAAIVFALTGCDSGTPPAPADAAASATETAAASAPASASAARPTLRVVSRREGSAVARAVGEEALYVADEDHKIVRRIPLPLDVTKAAAIPVPGAPAAVLPLAGRALVTIRDPGLLLVMTPDPEKGLVESARVALPADAWGVAVTPDEKLALVTSAWTHKLSAIDLASATVKWTLDVPREPRAVVARPDGASAYVTHLTGAAITRVDDLAGTPKIKAIELPPAPARAPSGKTLNASLAYSAVLDDTGARLFVPRHALGALGQGSWWGATTVDVLATKSDTPVLLKRVPGLPMARNPLIVKMIDASLVTNLDISGMDLSPVIQPRAVAYRKRTKTILVAGEGDDRVAELDALSVAPMMRPLAIYKVGSNYDAKLPVAGTCGAPSGLALSADESRLWVYCRSTGDLAEVTLVDPDRPPPSPPSSPDAGVPPTPAQITSVHLADDALGKEEALGRRFFYNATDPIVSGGLGCAGCHPEGRDDGHVWHEAKVTSPNESERLIFIGEPENAPNAKENKIGWARQTPMLAGRVNARGPYGWHAQNADLVERLKEGFGLHRWTSVYNKGVGEQLARIQVIRAFAQKGLVPPPREKREPTAEEKRGKEIFTSEQARCSRCHVPETDYTDRVAYPFSPKVAPLPGFEDDPKSEFRTPSLLFVGGSPPYFHDGRFKTLEELIDRNDDRMGHTSHLSKDDRAALVAFLRTL